MGNSCVTGASLATDPQPAKKSSRKSGRSREKELLKKKHLSDTIKGHHDKPISTVINTTAPALIIALNPFVPATSGVDPEVASSTERSNDAVVYHSTPPSLQGSVHSAGSRTHGTAVRNPLGRVSRRVAPSQAEEPKRSAPAVVDESRSDKPISQVALGEVPTQEDFLREDIRADERRSSCASDDGSERQQQHRNSVSCVSSVSSDAWSRNVSKEDEESEARRNSEMSLGTGVMIQSSASSFSEAPKKTPKARDAASDARLAKRRGRALHDWISKLVLPPYDEIPVTKTNSLDEDWNDDVERKFSRV